MTLSHGGSQQRTAHRLTARGSGELASTHESAAVSFHPAGVQGLFLSGARCLRSWGTDRPTSKQLSCDLQVSFNREMPLHRASARCGPAGVEADAHQISIGAPHVVVPDSACTLRKRAIEMCQLRYWIQHVLLAVRSIMSADPHRLLRVAP